MAPENSSVTKKRDVLAAADLAMQHHQYYLPSMPYPSVYEDPKISKTPPSVKTAHKPNKPSKFRKVLRLRQNKASTYPKDLEEQQVLATPTMPKELSRSGPLCQLPAEILLIIVDYLDEVSAVCLRTTSRYMHASVLPEFNPNLLTECAKWLITCRFEQDMTVLSRKVACAFCKVKHYDQYFTPSNRSFSYHNTGVAFLNLLNVRPEERYCMAWIRGAMIGKQKILPKSAVPWGFSLPPQAWKRYQQLTCMHCHGEISPEDKRTTGCLFCRCNVCPRRHTPRLKRLGSAPDTGYTKIRKFKSTNGKLFVVEDQRWSVYSANRSGKVAVPVEDLETGEAIEAY